MAKKVVLSVGTKRGLFLLESEVMFWLWYEGQGAEKISNHALYTFWYVIPTLPMFLVMPAMKIASALSKPKLTTVAAAGSGPLAFGVAAESHPE